jgi:hypothetical protein
MFMNTDHKSRSGPADARRILPSFVELFEQRIIFIGTPIDDAVGKWRPSRHHAVHSPAYSDVLHGTGCFRGRISTDRRATR